jgi:hypothetical protein
MARLKYSGNTFLPNQYKKQTGRHYVWFCRIYCFNYPTTNNSKKRDMSVNKEYVPISINGKKGMISKSLLNNVFVIIFFI